jgi:NAD(P)-dependent dehydrogenase (short-subunit alcohol dehydrogenase family)
MLRQSLKPVLKYWPEYEWSNVWEMVRNMTKPPALCEEDFSGRLVVITGATSGIGYHTARTYAARGARLLTVNRNLQKSELLCAEIRRDFSTDCDFILADLSLLDAMHQTGKTLATLDTPIDVLIHNAGLYRSKRQVTLEGLESNFAVHFLAPFVINHLLREKLKRDGRSRILFVGSEGYRFAAWGLRMEDLQWNKHRYSGLKAYGAAKLAQILTMHVLARELSPAGVTVNAMHPGMVRTNTGHENGALYRFFKRHGIDRLSQPAEFSAQALYHLGVSPALQGVTDRFFHFTTEEELNPPARDMEAAEQIWQIALQEGRLT